MENVLALFAYTPTFIIEPNMFFLLMSSVLYRTHFDYGDFFVLTACVAVVSWYNFAENRRFCVIYTTIIDKAIYPSRFCVMPLDNEFFDSDIGKTTKLCYKSGLLSLFRGWTRRKKKCIMILKKMVGLTYRFSSKKNFSIRLFDFIAHCLAWALLCCPSWKYLL